MPQDTVTISLQLSDESASLNLLRVPDPAAAPKFIQSCLSSHIHWSNQPQSLASSPMRAGGRLQLWAQPSGSARTRPPHSSVLLADSGQRYRQTSAPQGPSSWKRSWRARSRQRQLVPGQVCYEASEGFPEKPLRPPRPPRFQAFSWCRASVSWAAWSRNSTRPSNREGTTLTASRSIRLLSMAMLLRGARESAGSTMYTCARTQR